MSATMGWLLTTSLPAQEFNLIHTFNGIGTGFTNLDGYSSHADLVLSGNTLYGTAPLGGTNGYGTIFSVNTDGSDFTVLHAFTGAADGTVPDGHLVLCEGTLYGLVGRGTNLVGGGSIFSMSTNGQNFNILYTFTDSANGALSNPNGGMVMGDGALYGTTWQGGITNQGTIFSLNMNGTFTLLHQFSQYTDGENPLGTLVLTNGILYGTARNYGTNGVSGGTIFSITTNGLDFTVLRYLGPATNLSAHTPNTGLTLNGNTLYGTTAFGGTNNGGTVFAINTDGSGFSVLHSFNTAAGEGKIPEGELVLGGNTLYGSTLGSGSELRGTIYSVNTDGSSFTTLHTFTQFVNDLNTNADGSQPYDKPLLSGNVLYGSTTVGGVYGDGTLFSMPIVPLISNLTVARTNVTLNAIEGIQNETCVLLASTNLSLPLAAWTSLATNTLASGGDFAMTITNSPNLSLARQFYTLQVTLP